MVEFGRVKDRKLALKVLETLKHKGISAQLSYLENKEIALYIEGEQDLAEAQDILRVALGMPSQRVYEIEPEWKNISKVPLTEINSAFIFISVVITIGLLVLGYESLFDLLSFRLSATEPWRIFTPVFMHFSFLHILFNMLWMKDLGSVVEYSEGKLFFLFFCIIVGSLSNLAQGLIVGNHFGGMSGIVYGFVGFTWARGYLDKSYPYKLPKRDYLILFGFYLLCYTGLIGKIANVAHGVGIGLGLLFALSLKSKLTKNMKVAFIGITILISSCIIEYLRFLHS